MPLQTVESSDDKALQEIANNLFRSHKVVVITGAGISTSAGIPDFRSRDGLYNLIPEQAFKSLPTPPSSNPSTPFLKRTFDVFSDDQNPDTPSPKHLKLGNNDTSTPPSSQSSTTSTSSKRSSLGSRLKGEDLFSSRVWNSSQSAAVFYRFIASLRQQVYSENTKATATHKFIRALRDGGRLMRCYTQNIDGLESRVGLCTDLSRGKGNKRRFMKKYYEAPLDILDQNHDGGCEVVSLHGDLDKLRCTLCHDLFEWSQEHTEIFLEAAAPKCNTCTQKSQEREATGKRGLCIGALTTEYCALRARRTRPIHPSLLWLHSTSPPGRRYSLSWERRSRCSVSRRWYATLPEPFTPARLMDVSYSSIALALRRVYGMASSMTTSLWTVTTSWRAYTRKDQICGSDKGIFGSRSRRLRRPGSEK